MDGLAVAARDRPAVCVAMTVAVPSRVADDIALPATAAAPSGLILGVTRTVLAVTETLLLLAPWRGVAGYRRLYLRERWRLPRAARPAGLADDLSVVVPTRRRWAIRLFKSA